MTSFIEAEATPTSVASKVFSAAGAGDCTVAAVRDRGMAELGASSGHIFISSFSLIEECVLTLHSGAATAAAGRVCA
jgi:hypothetical protein